MNENENTEQQDPYGLLNQPHIWRFMPLYIHQDTAQYLDWRQEPCGRLCVNDQTHEV